MLDSEFRTNKIFIDFFFFQAEDGRRDATVTGVQTWAIPISAADLLVVDDNSPDGTGDLADKLAEADPHVQVMHRTEKAGLGRAYIAGFGWALERGYDVIVEMDADG